MSVEELKERLEKAVEDLDNITWKRIVSALLLSIMMMFSGCLSFTDDSPVEEDFTILFQSGFEPDSIHVFDDEIGAPCSDDIWGNDYSSQNGDWEIDLEGQFIGESIFCFGGGNRTHRGIDIVVDDSDDENHVLHTWIIEPAENISDTDDIPCNGELPKDRKARVQHVLKNLNEVNNFQYQVSLKLGESFNNLSDSEYEFNWMTIGEYWNNLPTENHSFRITLNIIKPNNISGTPFYFGLKAESQADDSTEWISEWERQFITDIIAPIGEWFTIDVTIFEGDDTDGQVILKINTDEAREEISITGWTHHPEDPNPDGFSALNTMKLYTGGGVMCSLNSENLLLEAWWDDFQLGIL